MGLGTEWHRWLLIALGLAALVPVFFIIRRVRAATAPRDITAPPPEPFDWRADPDLRLSLLALGGILVVALAIGLPRWWTEINAVSPFAFLLIGYGAYLGFLVVQGLIRGSIRLQLRGFSAVYDRAGQPKRYWGTVVANVVIACFFLGLAVLQFTLPSPQRIAADKRDNDLCYAPSTPANGAAAAAACSRLLAENRDPTDRPYDLNARASAYAVTGHNSRAAADNAEALKAVDRLMRDHPDDKDLATLRGQIVDRRWRIEGELGRLGDAIVRDPVNVGLRIDRSRAWAKYQDYPDAITDLDEADRLAPGNVPVLAQRVLYHALSGQTVAARHDLDEAERLAPDNPIPWHGEAVLADVQGKRDAQLAWLARSLAADMNDDWALERRARVYESAGDIDRARADWDRLRAIRDHEGRPLTGT